MANLEQHQPDTGLLDSTKTAEVVVGTKWGKRTIYPDEWARRVAFGTSFWDEQLRMDYIQRLMATRGFYEKVIVVPIAFQQMDFGYLCQELLDEINELGDRFSKSFGHDVREIFRIPASEGQKKLHEMLKGVLDELICSGPGGSYPRRTLLIILYTGHGRVSAGNFYLEGKGPSKINWTMTQELMLDKAPCDVAQLLDCCYGGAATKYKINWCKEVLAAAGEGFETRTGDGSYFKAIAKALDKLVAQRTTLIALKDLHREAQAITTEYNTTHHLDAHTKQPTRFRGLRPGSFGKIYLRPLNSAENDQGR